MSKWIWGRKWFSRRIALFSKLLFLSVYAPIQTLTNQWTGCTTRQQRWLHLSLKKIREIWEGGGEEASKSYIKGRTIWWDFTCYVKRIPKLSTIRMLRAVVYCKWILNNSCWQSYRLLRAAKSHCFITNLTKLDGLFKHQFKGSLTNEFLDFFFLSF